MIMRAENISGESIGVQRLFWGPRLLTFLSKMRRLFEGSAIRVNTVLYK